MIYEQSGLNLTVVKRDKSVKPRTLSLLMRFSPNKTERHAFGM